MMKQPAGNANATPEEEREAALRAEPLARDVDHEEIAEVARDLWRVRGQDGGSPERDWFEAERIVRERRAATTGLVGSAGNNNGSHESYVASDGHSGAEQSVRRKEQIEVDQNYNTGTMDRSGSNLMNQAEQYIDREPKTTPRPEHREGPVARTLEQQTARIPSDAWLWAAFGSIGLSLALELSGKEKTANFVGHWAPTFLIIGLYNKIVKLQGSDAI